jgi:hypothetical protein
MPIHIGSNPIGDMGNNINRVYKGTTLIWPPASCANGLNNDTFSTGTGDGYNDRVMNIVPDGSDIFVAGWFTSYKGNTRNRISKISQSDGTEVSGFSGNANNRIRPLIIDGDNVYIGGNFTEYNSTTRRFVAKISRTTGAINSSFGNVFPTGTHTIEALAIHGDNLYIGGSFPGSILKVDKDTGAIDTNFDVGSDKGWVRNIRVELDVFGNSIGTLLAVSSNGRRFRVDLSDGSDASPASITDPSNTDARGLYADLNIPYISSRQPSSTFWRVDRYSGSSYDKDTSFNNDNKFFNGMVISIVPFGDGTHILALGEFDRYMGQLYNGMVKINMFNGNPDPEFHAGLNIVRSDIEPFIGAVVTARRIGNSIYIGGEFSSYRGVSVGNIAKIDLCT